jgi:hypothetical protein
VFEDGVLRIIFLPERDKITGKWRQLHNGSFIICTYNQILLSRSNHGE